jgi:hypothetical protein
MNANVREAVLYLREHVANLVEARDALQRKIDAINDAIDKIAIEPGDKTYERLPIKSVGRCHPSKAPNAGLTEAIRQMMRTGDLFTPNQIWSAMAKRYSGLARENVQAILSYNVIRGRMYRKGRRGHLKYGLHQN